MSKKNDYIVWGIALVASILAVVSLFVTSSALTGDIAAISAVAALVDVLLAMYFLYTEKEEEEEDAEAKAKSRNEHHAAGRQKEKA